MPAYESNGFNPPAPIALVTLRNNESGSDISNVPLLIDSGADVTLIPLPFVTQLNLSSSASPSYEMEGFDGRKSTSQSVHLELLFLNRVFKGEFLIIDQDYGYLGRNILNHLSLLLDGPNSNWNAQQ